MTERECRSLSRKERSGCPFSCSSNTARRSPSESYRENLGLFSRIASRMPAFPFSRATANRFARISSGTSPDRIRKREKRQRKTTPPAPARLVIRNSRTCFSSCWRRCSPLSTASSAIARPFPKKNHSLLLLLRFPSAAFSGYLVFHHAPKLYGLFPEFIHPGLRFWEGKPRGSARYW